MIQHIFFLCCINTYVLNVKTIIKCVILTRAIINKIEARILTRLSNLRSKYCKQGFIRILHFDI